MTSHENKESPGWVCLQGTIQVDYSFRADVSPCYDSFKIDGIPRKHIIKISSGSVNLHHAETLWAAFEKPCHRRGKDSMDAV